MIVSVKVRIQVDPSPEERLDVARSYEPTPEVPEPDEEWICEEIAMRRLDEIKGVIGQDVLETTEEARR